MRTLPVSSALVRRTDPLRLALILLGMTLVNLGCGSTYHRDWINIDIDPSSPDVRRHDLATGIPLDSESADAVYHSHVLEHLTRQQASAFIRECLRVLKPGGILRVAVPDLEGACRAYLRTLEVAAANPTAPSLANHEWMCLELVDQLTREKSGGDQAAFALRRPTINRDFVVQRTGAELLELLDQDFSTDARRPGGRRYLAKAVGRARLLPRAARSAFLSRSDRRALSVGRFRATGEVHRWMYDRVSLARLLSDVGFTGVGVVSAETSEIPRWASFCLDVLPDGAVRKPDSLFMEAQRPKR